MVNEFDFEFDFGVTYAIEDNKMRIFHNNCTVCSDSQN